jgi:uncharacterized protein (DUF433 family)
MDPTAQVDWSKCEWVESKPTVQSGALVVRGTRVPVSAILGNSEYGMSPSEICEQFDVTLAQVNAILEYANEHRIAHTVR